MFTSEDQEAVRLGTLNQELSLLLLSPSEDHDAALGKLVEQYGSEDVLWMLNVLKNDMAS